MVFFVPDLDDYFALRRPLFPYEGTAPGPWTSSTEEVADALSDVAGLRTALRRATSSSSTSGSTPCTTGTPASGCSRRSSPTQDDA